MPIAAGSDMYYKIPGKTRGEASLLMFRAYLESGMTPAQHGHWNLFYRDPARSPFRWTRPLGRLPRLTALVTGRGGALSGTGTSSGSP